MSAAAVIAADSKGAAPVTTYPWLGILAVLLGAIASTLTARLTTNGLADIRGAIGAGFDEGAWIPTAYTVAQMLVGPISVWVGRIAGVRTVLLWGAVTFAISELLIPLVPSLGWVLALQALAGLGSGTFIPLTIGFILQSLPARLWSFGIAAYAMNLELSLNIGATIEGWYSEHASWHWIFWQNAVLALPLIACIWLGIPRSKYDRETARHGDYWGMAFAATGLSLLYAALDQGDRLDWGGSDLIVGLGAAGLILVAAFLIHEADAEKPGVDLSILLRTNMLLLLMLVALIRSLVIASNYLVPQFLILVRGLRPLQVGDALLWVALPQFLLAPAVAWLLNHVDGRRVKIVGMIFLIAANLEASCLTSAWAEGDFIVPQLLQAVGQSLALTSIIFVVVKHLTPAEAIPFGALLQTARLLGGEIGSAGLQAYSRKTEQFNSNLIGVHVGSYDQTTLDRLQEYSGQLLAVSQGAGAANARALGLLDGAIRMQSYTLAFADAFLCTAGVAAFGIVLVLLLRSAPSTPPTPKTGCGAGSLE